MQKILTLALSVVMLSFSITAIAAPAVATTAREETTPPGPEGPLSANQIPPIMNIGAQLPVKPAAPAAPSPEIISDE